MQTVAELQDSVDASERLSAVLSPAPTTPMSVALIGPGQVGLALLQQLLGERDRLREHLGVSLTIAAVANSQRMRLLGRQPVVPADCLPVERSPATDFDQLLEHLQASGGAAVVIDCSASEYVSNHYAQWLEAGVHVITPNKKAGSGDAERYRAVREAARRGQAQFRYEATVGAGLPVVQTLRELLDTGDEVVSVEGVLSGTLAALFNRFQPQMSFAELVAKAHQEGLTEPHPADDLSGEDVARKLVILAREIGLPLSLDQVDVEPVTPLAWAERSPEQYLASLGELDEAMRKRCQQAQDEGKVLRYVARLGVEDGSAEVKLVAVDADNPLAGLRGPDNLLVFRTKRYHADGLVVRGPGAGPEVTAGGVFADLLRVANRIGARA